MGWNKGGGGNGIHGTSTDLHDRNGPVFLRLVVALALAASNLVIGGAALVGVAKAAASAGAERCPR